MRNKNLLMKTPLRRSIDQFEKVGQDEFAGLGASFSTVMGNVQVKLSAISAGLSRR